MWAAVPASILSNALWFVSLELDVYAAVMAAFVRWYEEPTLSRQHGSSYDAHRAQVPAWIPRRQAEGL